VKPKISLKPDTPLKVAGIGIDLPFYKRVLSHMDRPEWWVFDRHVKLTRASAPEAFGKDFIDSKFVIHNEWCYHYLRSFHAFDLEADNPRVKAAWEAAWEKEGRKSKKIEDVGIVSFTILLCKR